MKAVAAVLTVALLASCGGSSDEEKAYGMCKSGIREQLKAPATADFAGLDDVKVTERDADFQFIGSVDSENTFGANLRSRFNCRVEKDSGGLVLKSAHLIDED